MRSEILQKLIFQLITNNGDSAILISLYNNMS